MDKCRDEDSDDSEVAASNPVHGVSVARDKPFCSDDLRLEFASWDVDSNAEDDGKDR